MNRTIVDIGAAGVTIFACIWAIFELTATSDEMSIFTWLIAAVAGVAIAELIGAIVDEFTEDESE